MCVVFCRCGISTRFSMRTSSTSKVQTGRPASSRNDDSHRAASNSLPPAVSIMLCSDTSAAVRIADALPDVVQHHRAAERCRQRGDEIRVIAARQRARQRPRRVATEAVGDQPFLLRQRPASLVGRLPSDWRARVRFACPRRPLPRQSLRVCPAAMYADPLSPRDRTAARRPRVPGCAIRCRTRPAGVPEPP